MRATSLLVAGFVLVASCADPYGAAGAPERERADGPGGAPPADEPAVDEPAGPSPADGGGAGSSTSSSSSGGASSSGGTSSSSSSGGASSSGGTSSSGGASDPYAVARTACVLAVNKLRAKHGLPQLLRYTGKEACADQQAAKDASMNAPHFAYFNGAPSCIENNVLDRQNECPGWYAPVDKAATDCVAKMYAEGPGSGPAHGHYNVLMNPSYTKLSCGVNVKPGAPATSATWLVLNFY